MSELRKRAEALRAEVQGGERLELISVPPARLSDAADTLELADELLAEAYRLITPRGMDATTEPTRRQTIWTRRVEQLGIGEGGA